MNVKNSNTGNIIGKKSRKIKMLLITGVLKEFVCFCFVVVVVFPILFLLLLLLEVVLVNRLAEQNSAML